MSFDSRIDTIKHIRRVRGLLLDVAWDLVQRGHRHDRSKLEEPELSIFDEFTPKLADTTYGSDEYKGYLAEMGEGLKHHYAHNDHHPEHFPNGIADMHLVQLLEMFCDWKAATERHKDGNLEESIRKNAERFEYGPEIERLLLNTARHLGWI